MMISWSLVETSIVETSMMAYTVELEAELNNLKEINARLRDDILCPKGIKVTVVCPGPVDTLKDNAHHDDYERHIFSCGGVNPTGASTVSIVVAAAALSSSAAQTFTLRKIGLGKENERDSRIKAVVDAVFEAVSGCGVKREDGVAISILVGGSEISGTELRGGLIWKLGECGWDLQWIS